MRIEKSRDVTLYASMPCVRSCSTARAETRGLGRRMSHARNVCSCHLPPTQRHSYRFESILRIKLWKIAVIS